MGFRRGAARGVKRGHGEPERNPPGNRNPKFLRFNEMDRPGASRSREKKFSILEKIQQIPPSTPPGMQARIAMRRPGCPVNSRRRSPEVSGTPPSGTAFVSTLS